MQNFEVSVVSLRDVARCIYIFEWFLQHFDVPRIEHKPLRDQYFLYLIESMILALAHCYYYRLGTFIYF